MGGLHLITSAPSHITRWRNCVLPRGALVSWIFSKGERPEIGVILVFIAGLIQLLACVGWIIWAAVAESGVPWYVSLAVATVLILGVVTCDFARRQLETRAALAAELQRLRSQDPLERRLETVKERLRSIETLREWGFVTETEYKEKRRSLLDLEQPGSRKVVNARKGRPSQ